MFISVEILIESGWGDGGGGLYFDERECSLSVTHARFVILQSGKCMEKPRRPSWKGVERKSRLIDSS